MKIFLDIDGVMVHANPHKLVDMEEDGFYKFNINAINAINSFDFKNVEIILSTSHRFRFSKKQWKIIFRSRGLNFEKISIMNISLEHRIPRKMEIESWIIEHKYKPQDIIIIDDDKSLNSLSAEYKSRLVLTNSFTGLNSKDELERFFDEIL